MSYGCNQVGSGHALRLGGVGGIPTLYPYSLIGRWLRPPTVCSRPYIMDNLLTSAVSEAINIGETIVSTMEKPIETLVESTTSTLALKQGGPVAYSGITPVPIKTPGLQPMAYDTFFSRSVPSQKFEVTGNQSFMHQYSSFNVVGQLTSDDKPLSHLFKMWRYWKADVVLTLQMNAPKGSAGAVLMVALPPGHYVDREKWSPANISNMLSVVLDFGRHTEATLRIPYLNYKDSYPTKPSEPDGNLDVSFYNWATYNHPSGSPNSISAICYIALENLSTTCPRLIPQAPDPPPGVNEKSVRTKFKFTDPKSIVMPSDGAAPLSNAHDVSSNLSLAVAGERVYYRKCGAYKRVEDFGEVARTYAFIMEDDLSINNFCHGTWTSANAHDHTLSKASLKINHMGNVGVLAPHFGAYSGSLVFKLSVFSTSMSTGKIALIIACEPSESDSSDISLARMGNAIYGMLDISSHATVEVHVPYMYNSWCRASDNNPIIRAYVKVVNPLGNSGPMNSNVYWHVMVKAGDDFRFLWPRDHDFRVQGPLRSWGSEMDIVDPLTRDEMIEKDLDREEPNVMPVDAAYGSNPVLYKHSPVSYTRLSLLLGKMEFITDHEYAANTSEVHIGLHVPKKGALSLVHLFAYWNGEVNITITNDSNNSLIVRHTYTNDSVRIDNNAHLAIPPRRIASFTVPFYCRDNMRKIIGDSNDPVFGHLFFNCGYEQGSFKVFMSLREPNCYYMMPYRKKATSRDILRNIALHNIGSTEAKQMVGTTQKDYGPSGTRILLTNSSWCRDLTSDGDIESNPGPTYQLCYQDRGMYKHYGVTNGEKVYHTNTDNIIRSALKGVATVQETDLTDAWVVEERSFITQDKPEVGLEIPFNLESNCESWARDFVHDNSTTQATVLAMLTCTIMLTLGTYVCYDEDVSSALSALYMAISRETQSSAIKSIVRFLVRCVCYSIMFCSKPGFLTGTSLATLLFMDYQDITQRSNKPWIDGFVKSALEGDVNGLFESVAEAIEDESEQENAVSSTIKYATNQGIEDFNRFSNMAKNVEWWIKTITGLIQWAKEMMSPKETVKFAKFVAERPELLASLFTTVQALADTPLHARDDTFREKYDYVKFLLDSYIESANRYDVSSTLTRNLLAARNKLSSIKINDTKSLPTNRVEPVGVWITGPPGAGKTFLANLLAKKIRNSMGWGPGEIYNHPTASAYFDSYAGQKIHIIDDLGQNADEEDMKHVCQMISAMQWQVPMADLDSKGMWYTSQVVVATTNKQGWDSKVLNTRDALARRFPVVLDVRAKKQYQHSGKLDVGRNLQSIKDGLVWEDHQGTPIDVDEVADKVVNILRARTDVLKDWEDFINQSPSDPFKRLLLALDDTCAFVEVPRLLEPSERFLLQTQLICAKVKKWINKHKILVYLVGALSLVVGAVSAYKYFKKPEKETDSQVYSGHPTGVPKVTKFRKKDIVDQRPVNEYSHLHKVVSCIIAGDAVVHTLNYGKELLTYGHSEDLLAQNDLVFCDRGNKKHIEDIEFTPITVSGEPTDLAILAVDNRERCSFLRYTSDQIGTESAIMWYDGETYTVMGVKNVVPIGPSQTVNGTKTHATLQYEAHTGPGTCGGALITKVGGNWKIIGIHIAGNGYVGRAVDLRCRSQGIHTRVDLQLNPVHIPSKTKLRESPYHGVVPVIKQPAVLNAQDKRRLPLPITHPYNNIFMKHTGNVFTPNLEKFGRSMEAMIERLATNLGVHAPVSIDEAVFGLNSPINMSASSGWPYVDDHVSRKQLINYETKWIHPDLRKEIQEDYDRLLSKPIESVYLTFLKDELRSSEKVFMGSTRVIECAPLKEVILFRMLFGVQFDLICATPLTDTGLAVGVNPYKDWALLVNALYKNNYLFDYKGFDGSLSDSLLCFGAYILSHLTTEPNRFLNLAASSIWSTHHGPWDYQLDGSMPSGSPFTTLLNSVVNLLVVDYVVDEPYFAVTYGDDLVLSSDSDLDPAKIKTTLKEEFGMTITAHDKKENITPYPPHSVVFLKRTPKWVTPTTCVGALGIDEMLQHIMWCRGDQEFLAQKQSFELELALHGQVEYERVAALLAGRGHDLTPWCAAKIKMHQLIYD